MKWSWCKEPSLLIGAANFVLLLLVLITVARLPAGRSAGGDVDAETVSLADPDRLSFVEAELPSIELHTRADAEELVAQLGQFPKAVKLADALATIETWMGTDDEQSALQDYKLEQIGQLRLHISQELAALHDQVLKADNSRTATDLYAEAGQLLALYPMDTSREVLEESRRLSSKHAVVGNQISVIRRQRYNAWALSKIEESLKSINDIATSFKTSDNLRTIEATVKQLGEVDPMLLEPVVAELYNYAIEQAKSNVNSDQQLELARRLVEPVIQRKGLGDF